jgi:hypothetical protein
MLSPTSHAQGHIAWPKRFARAARAVIRWTFYALAALWTAGAVYVDGPLGMNAGNAWLAVGWLAAATGCLALIRAPWKRCLVWLALELTVLVPWLGKSPSNDRVRKREQAETGWVNLQRGELSFHNFRNFDYGLDGSVTENWETRRVHLRNLKGVDYFHVAFGGDLIAHPILSFDFEPDGRIALSVETRREVSEEYSEIGVYISRFPQSPMIKGVLFFMPCPSLPRCLPSNNSQSRNFRSVICGQLRASVVGNGAQSRLCARQGTMSGNLCPGSQYIASRQTPGGQTSRFRRYSWPSIGSRETRETKKRVRTPVSGSFK